MDLSRRERLPQGWDGMVLDPKSVFYFTYRMARTAWRNASIKGEEFMDLTVVLCHIATMRPVGRYMYPYAAKAFKCLALRNGIQWQLLSYDEFLGPQEGS